MLDLLHGVTPVNDAIVSGAVSPWEDMGEQAPSLSNAGFKRGIKNNDKE